LLEQASMRRRHLLSVLVVLSFSVQTAAAQPGATDAGLAFEPEPVTTSYRGYTLAADATSLALLLAGAHLERPGGGDTRESDALFTVGGLGAFFASPIIHLARGHGGRAMSSFLIRGVLASAGMYTGIIMMSGCEGLLCELDGIGPGMFGGLVVASLIDAAFFTTEVREVREDARTWTPQVSASSEGARIGVAGTF
jgi:hypothetical protein